MCQLAVATDRVLRWLDDVELVETAEAEMRRNSAATAAAKPPSPPPSPPAAARRSASAGRRAAPAAKQSGFSLSSLFGCFGKPSTRH